MEVGQQRPPVCKFGELGKKLYSGKYRNSFAARDPGAGLGAWGLFAQVHQLHRGEQSHQ
jgi:hypothetical protein